PPASNWDVHFLNDTDPVIEGWQRMEVEFTVPPGVTNVWIRVGPTATTGLGTNFYIDDLRIQPVESIMTGYVYNPETLRLMSQLDENNYATYYEYDDEGKLIRVKRETDRGVMTISEQHNNLGITQE
ncbi:MAG: hypothetical protein AAF828_09830, partial [Bacteroidota bacterium]